MFSVRGGESEVAYISHLRSQYRAPIQIIPRKSDSNISIRYIENCKRDYIETENDKTFLMFDFDEDGMLEHLQSIPDAVLLVSNPCIELLKAKQLCHPKQNISRNSATGHFSTFRALLKATYKERLLKENLNDFIEEIEYEEVRCSTMPTSRPHKFMPNS